MNGRTDTDAVRTLLELLKPALQPQVPLIRVGPEGDGGYLIPDDLYGIDHVFSPGVDAESGFEAALSDRGIISHLADYSVEKPAVEHRNFTFTRKFVGPFDNAQYMTMNTWVQSAAGSYAGDMLMQMDIEGDEYETILCMPQSLLRRYRTIIIELHELGRIFERKWYFLLRSLMTKMLEDHVVVHVHPNNGCGVFRRGDLVVPEVLEITFYRRDREFMDVEPRLPHPLDSKNVPNRPDLPIPAWLA